MNLCDQAHRKLSSIGITSIPDVELMTQVVFKKKETVIGAEAQQALGAA